jgi:2-dehydropantoate 2-reductase
VGTGGVGGYFGGRLAAAGADVAFVARGTNLDALRSRGLRIDSPAGNIHIDRVTATDDPAIIGPVDVVLFTVKLYDMDSATELLPPLLGPETVVIPFQNGVGAVDILTRSVGRAHVAGGTAYVAAVIAEPGVIRHTAWNRLVFGELDNSSSTRLQRFLEACRPAGFDATLSQNIEIDIWSKFVHLAVFSGMTTVSRLAVGPLRDDPEVFAMWQAAVLEGIAVAHKKGISLPSRTFDDVIANVQAVPPHAKSSMLQDLERGRRLELPWLSGAVVRMGREVDVDTPIHRFIATVLNPYVNGR